jgi:hypothetical protein
MECYQQQQQQQHSGITTEMEQEKTHMYRLDVFLNDIKITAVAMRSPVLAFRFLDYPSFFIHPADSSRKFAPQSHFKVRSGKSCVFMEAQEQLYSLLAEVRRHLPSNTPSAPSHRRRNSLTARNMMTCSLS